MSLAPEEIKAVQWLFAFMPERPVIVDCGSNKGTWSDIFLDEYGDNCEVHLFEPNELLLNYTRVKYDYKKNVHYHQTAVSDRVEHNKDFFYFTNYNNGLSSLLYNERWKDLPMQRSKVHTVTLDLKWSQLLKPFIDFIKIDVEGSDYDVLNGCRQILKEGKAGFIQVEYSEHWKLAGKTFEDLEMLVYPYFYQIYQYTDNGFVPIIKAVEQDCNLYITKLPIQNLSTGWNKPFIENTVNLKPHFALEIGSCEGLTAKYICEHLLTGKDARLICVDPLQDYYLKPGDMPEMVGQYQRWQANTRGLPINLIRKRSADAYDELKDFRFDLVYLDGDHTEEGVYYDGLLAIQVCKSGGTIIFDDYDNYADYTTRGIERVIKDRAPFIEVVKKNYQLVIRKV